MVTIKFGLCGGANHPSKRQRERERERESMSRNFAQGLFAPMNSSEQPKKRQFLCDEIKQHGVNSGLGEN